MPNDTPSVLRNLLRLLRIGVYLGLFETQPLDRRIMANFKYFADVNGETFELTNIRYDSRQRGAAQFSGRASNGELLTATRYIEYKSHPSKHVCDARCLNATGKVMKCECSCGGKNHGKGHSLMAVA